MKDTIELPNLLDNHVSRENVAGLIDRIRDVRQRVHDTWAVGRRDARGRAAMQRALDDALILALVAQYFGQRGDGRIPLDGWTERGSVRQMAQFAGETAPVGSHVFQNRIFANNLHWPDRVRHDLFTDHLPAAFGSFVGELPITVLGDFHQMCLANPLKGAHDERRAKGAHYTPASLVDYMVARSVAAARADGIDPLRMSILDPSCGCGAFLIAILRHLARAGVRQDIRTSSKCLYGSDIDARAIDLARLSLLMTATDSNTGRLPIRSSWDRRLVEQDFLAPRSWHDSQFDLIIGGPPFIRVEQLHDTDLQRVADYRQRYQTARSGQFDLYMLFMEKAIQLLRPGGRLAFSVSNSFLRSKSGAVMRRFLNENACVEEIVEFEDGNIYPDASVQIAVLLIRKGGVAGKTRYAFVPGSRPIRQSLERLLRPACKSVGGCRVLSARLHEDGSDAWNLRSPRDTAFLDHMEKAGMPLAKLPVRVSLGMCTGADDVFILRARRDASGRQILTTRAGNAVRIERAVLKPILRARQSALILRDMPNVCIFPYDSKGAVLAERTFRLRYPLAYQYLFAHKKRLASRRLCPGQPWFALRKADVACHLAKPKIIAPTIVGPGGFRLDRDCVLCHHGLLTIVPLNKKTDPHYLLGILNSSTMWRYICLRAARMAAGRRVVRLDLAKALPILLPQTPRQHALAVEIADRVRRHASEDSLDRLVSRLYGLP